MRAIKRIGLFVMLGGWVGAACAAECLSPEYLAVSPDGLTLYVTAATADKLLLVDPAAGRVKAEWTVRHETRRGFWGRLGFSTSSGAKRVAGLSGVAVAPDGTVYVTGGGVNGFLIKLNAEGSVMGQVCLGHTPLAPVVAPDGATVYVPNRFSSNVAVVDVASMTVSATVPMLREPFAAALGKDGALLFVANHLPAVRATNDVVAASVSVIDTAQKTVVRHLMLPNGSTGVRGICASPDGRFVYVTHTFGRYQLPTTQLERGWMNTAGLSVFDGVTGDYVNTALLDDVDLGAANPWGVTVTSDGKTLVVAHAGTHELSLIDRPAFHARLEKAARNEKVTEVTKSASDVPNDLSFLVTLRRRIRLPGNGPRGVVAVGDSVYAALYFTEELVAVKLGGPVVKPVRVMLGASNAPPTDPVRRGEMFWNDATLCFQQWQSCTSCHPEGRMDGLNWDLVNDGIGNPKQTKALVYCHLTPPTMVTGIRPDMESCNRKGLTHIQFVVRPEEDALCLDAYVMSLKPEPSPYLLNGRLSPLAKKGEAIFKKAGCAECHPSAESGPQGEPLFTNLKKYDLGLGVGNEEGREFDTPTLVETWRTAPYLYDGRALTMEEMLTVCNPKDTHGVTRALSPEEIRALAEYVLSF
ncbi:MAG TPA: c-type cytochrome [Kiritimatiellia bacterium]|nr:c-type cytochrome [Kiritimatiellia bacterium]HOM58946.1 c-type cytochrome [Kiritimatiellia bacterium]HPC49313.1 c-type cytochrome [Kiritimatiellia bacterium]HPK36927.1 c-type cytochrome [Kiritimatiellia bacterium]HRU19941.1 c-type cytochrome [Kiritimatiellia bacterium]